MRRLEADRQLVLAFLWFVGSLLTVATLILPYSIEIDETSRAAVAVLALLTAVGLVLAPPLSDWQLHGLLVVAAGVVAWCTHVGAATTEGVFFLLPMTYAFATFPWQRALPHLLLCAALYAWILAIEPGPHEASPAVAWVLTMGVGAMACFALSALAAARDRERAAGARAERIAEALQRALLPTSLPSPSGLAVDARYVPAARDADVGGDFFDAFELPDGRLALAIGDVAGKGLAAAATVGHVRSALRACAFEDAAPGRVLARLDLLLDRGLERSPMTTLLFGVLDPAGGELQLASAGHPGPLLVPADGAARYLELPTGPPLGVCSRGAYDADGATRLGHGDRLLLYTDGLVERRGETIDTGIARLVETVDAVGAEGADRLVEAALAVAPAQPEDDVALLAVERQPVAAQLEIEVPARAEALAPLRAALRGWLDGRLPLDDREDLVLAVTEAATNAVIHGSTSARATFSVRGEALGDMVRVVVRDDGAWRERVGAGGGGGYGLALMRALVDRVDVHPGERGTVVELERRIPA